MPHSCNKIIIWGFDVNSIGPGAKHVIFPGERGQPRRRCISPHLHIRSVIGRRVRP